jgi:hypothetical protein
MAEITAAQATQIAEQQIAGMNTFKIPEIPEESRLIGDYKIFNIYDEHCVVERGGLGTRLIHACVKGYLWEFFPHDGRITAAGIRQLQSQPMDTEHEFATNEGIYTRRSIREGETAYSRPCLIPKIVREGRPVSVREIAFKDWSGHDVALDVLGVSRPGYGHSLDQSNNRVKWGAFLAAGHVPTAEELKAARAQLTEKMRDIWNEAQNEYQMGPSHIQNISSLHRKADSFLGRQAMWNQEAKEMDTCPACQEPCPRGAAVHAKCGAVLDEEAVKRYKLKGFEWLWQKPSK